MLPTLRNASLGVFAALLASAATAQNPPAPVGPEAGEAMAALQAEIDALRDRAWLPSAAVRTSFGWRDNVLLSPFAPLARGFVRGEVEAIMLRPMRDRWELVSFLNGDVIRYFSAPPETGGEQQWVFHTEGRWQPAEPVRLSLKAVGYLRDMVVDLSETEARRIVAPTRVRGGYLAATPRVKLPAGFRLEPMVQIKRTDYRDYAGDYDEVRQGARLEWRRSSALILSAAWSEIRRRYAQRTQYTIGGRALPGTDLRFEQRDGEAKARTAWQAGGEWSLAAAVGRLENRDGASGYFDFQQKRGRLELAWQRAGWRISAEGEGKRLDYRNQTVGAGLAPPPRIAEDFETLVRVEREVSERWTLFAEHRWERSRSNEIEFSYRANTWLAGVQRNF
ncbi:MAG: hypothetical protein Q8N18_06280 [Opitutaceae bacterium]|nr:hypothetical protein [Opitutaceae bacterium]